MAALDSAQSLTVMAWHGMACARAGRASWLATQTGPHQPKRCEATTLTRLPYCTHLSWRLETAVVTGGGGRLAKPIIGIGITRRAKVGTPALSLSGWVSFSPDQRQTLSSVDSRLVFSWTMQRSCCSGFFPICQSTIGSLEVCAKARSRCVRLETRARLGLAAASSTPSRNCVHSRAEHSTALERVGCIDFAASAVAGGTWVPCSNHFSSYLRDYYNYLEADIRILDTGSNGCDQSAPYPSLSYSSQPAPPVLI